MGYEVVRLPKLGDYYLHFVMKGGNDHPLSGKSYILYNNDGEVVETGILDEEGKTSVLYDKLEKEYYIYIVDIGSNKIKSVQYDPNS